MIAPVPQWLLQWNANRPAGPARGLGAAPRRNEAQGADDLELGAMPAHLAADRAPALTAGLGLALREPASMPDIVAALAVIPNENLGWDEWNRVALATFVACDGALDGLTAFDAWSAKSPKYDGETTAARWREITGSPPSRIGFGTLLFQARAAAGPDWQPPSHIRVSIIPPEMQDFESAAGLAKEENTPGGINGVSHALPDSFTAVASTSNPLIKLNDQYAVIGNVGSKCLILSWVNSEVDQSVKIPCFQTFKSFAEHYANQYVKVAEEPKQLGPYWLKWTGRKTYAGITLAPGAPPLLANGYLNLWSGFAVEPQAGSWDRMKGHIVKVLAGGDPELARYIFRFAAWAVQHPGERAEAALVFRGAKGSGKGTFARAIKNLFGQHGLHIFSSKHLVGSFNGHLRNCLLLFADEAFWAGDKQGESVLKGMLTEPSLMIEQKGVDATPWMNRLHVIMAANADWAVPASHDERRYTVCDVSDAQVGNEDYFRSLHDELSAGGMAAMLHDMLNVNLGDWHPRRIVHNEALRSQKVQSLDPKHEWWEGVLQEGRLPFTIKEHRDQAPAAGLLEAARENVPKLRDISQTAFGRFLRDAGGIRLHDRTGSVWRFCELRAAREIWEKRFGKWKWGQESDFWQ